MNKSFIIISTIILSGALIFYLNKEEKPESNLRSLVKKINSSNLPWKAKYYPEFDVSDEKLKRNFGVINMTEGMEDLDTVVHSSNIKIERNFKPSDKWNCKSFDVIRDQSSCGSCWAVSAESVMSDRICIERIKNRKKDDETFLSSADIMANCRFCGHGCNGGYPNMAFKYLKVNGVVTGGEHGDNNSCYPYPFEKCSHHVKSEDYESCDKFDYKSPRKTNVCPNKNLIWKKSKYSMKKQYTIRGEQNIKRELMENGPMTASFKVLAGFMTYKSGVYNCSKDKGKFKGYHAVKLVGFGEEVANDGVLRKYWLVANNWNEQWGDNGYIKFDINSDCGISRSLVTGSGFYKKK